jgi:MFS family permease
MLLFVSYSLFSAYMIPYSAEKGFSNIGSFFLVHAIAMLIFRLACSRIIDKIGVGLVIVTGFIICGMSFAVIGLSKSMATVYLGAVLSAVGFGATLPSVQVLCIQSVTPIKRGVASNTNFLGIDLGQFLGPMIGGIVLKTYESTGRAYSTLYLFAIIPIALALLVYVVTRKIINRNLKAAENM